MTQPHPTVNVELRVTREGKRTLAHLTWKNTSLSRPADLMSFNLVVDGRLDNDVFDVSTTSGGRVTYLGNYSKRRVGPEHVRRLAPGERIEGVVDLSTYYDLPAGRAVTVAYDCIHQTLPPVDLFRLRSNAVVLPPG